MTVETSHWSDTFAVNRVARSASSGDYIQGKQLTYQMGELNDNAAVVSFERAGSILQGSDASDTIRGLAGTDIIDAKGGNDLVHGGNAADVISGGSGADELHGDFGKNTYLDQADGSVDLIAIKSDQHLMNWWYGTDGNNPNGEKADVIERLDANDQIKIIGVATEDLAFQQASIHGLSGIGIFADGALEAIYTGGDLSAQQLESMTTGDASNAAMNNQIWSYNFGSETPAVI
jgi:Ca2+-binding RTX toxin-like protein